MKKEKNTDYEKKNYFYGAVDLYGSRHGWMRK